MTYSPIPIRDLIVAFLGEIVSANRLHTPNKFQCDPSSMTGITLAGNMLMF